MIRVLHLDSGREFRGGQRQMLLLALGLESRGYQQVILAPGDSPLYTESLKRGVEAAPLSLGALVREARRADLIHAHDARSHTLAALLPATRPVIVSRRVAFPVGTGWLSRWKYRRPARFLAVSEFVKQRLLEAGVAGERISVVYDGVEIPNSATDAARRPVVIAPATDDPQKGSALARAACRAARVELRFSNTLDEDVPQAGLFLYLSHSEGLGSAILVAMAHRTPVVASRTGGIPEIVEHERTGLLVENSIDAIAAAIQRVFDDPQAAAERAKAAYARLLARFTDAIMVAQTEQAYQVAFSSQASALSKTTVERKLR